MKKIILISSLISSLIIADVKNTMSKSYNNYRPMYNYSYSYSRLVNLNSYASKYLEIKGEHEKVVRLLNNANKTINKLKIKLKNVKRNNEFWRNKAKENKDPITKSKREEAIKKMKEQLKVNQ